MTWLHVGLFAGLLAMALPVVLHLLSRGKPRPVVFPALRLIQAGITRQARGFRIRRWLLLFLRMSAIALLALLLAGPWLAIPTPASVRTGPLDVVLILDDSASMSARVSQSANAEHEEMIWERARRQAETFVAQLPAGSRAGGITSAGLSWAEGFEECPPGVRAPQPLTPDLNAVQAYLKTLRVQSHGETLWPAITLAAEWLANRPEAEKADPHPPTAIVVFSDFAGGVLDGPRPTLPPDLQLVWTHCAAPGLNPPAITGLQLPSAVLPTSTPLRLSAEVRIPPNSKAAALRWSVDGKNLPTTTVAPGSAASSPPQGEGRVRVESHSVGLPPEIPPILLEAGRLEPGLHQVSLQLEPSDAWPAGAQAYGAVEAGSLPVVALVTSAGQPPSSRNLAAFLAALAFAPPSLPAERQHQTLRSLAPADLTAEKLTAVQLLVLADAKPLTPRQTQAVEDFVSAGGHVLTIPGPGPTGEARGNGPLFAPWSRVSSSGPWHFQVQDYKDPLLQPFAEGQPSLAAPIFTRIYGLAGEAAAAPVVLRFDNGQPALTRTSGPLPRGSITWLAFSPHPDDSNLAQVGAAGTWVVLLDRLAELARPASRRASNVEVGRMVHLPPSPTGGGQGGGPSTLDQSAGGRVESSPSSITPATLTLLWPDGTPHPLQPGPEGEASFRAMETGFYRLDRDKQEPALIACNIPAGETNFKMLDVKTLLELYGPKQTQAVTNLAEAKWARTTPTARKPLAGELALLLLLVLIAESYLANRFYGSSEAAKTPR